MGQILRWVLSVVICAMPISLPAVAASFVDESACVNCHTGETTRWKASHHAAAMAAARDETVLGDFNNAAFTYNGITSRFFRKGAEFWVETDGPDGKIGQFKVAYTFGVAPLQQYLIAMPEGRLQALGIAWDISGRRWFHLYPNDKLTAKDDLHWTKPQQNANFMCIECHVTDLKRNFDLPQKSFNSTWQALGVGCQACHGPASRHLEWANKAKGASGDANTGFDVSLKTAGQQTIVETCARCHARRAPLADGYSVGNRLADDYAVSLLTEQLYHVDGKIKDEVFEYGSFAQSKMFLSGVSCVSCHEPHGAKLRLSGNAVCLQCHGTDEKLRTSFYIPPQKLKNYDSPEHTHHPVGASGSFCKDCHMPGKYYMGVDFRHDHSMSIPRPDLSQKLGTGNACSDCHTEHDAQWAAKQVETWYGKKTQPKSYGEIMWELRHGGVGATEDLKRLAQSADTPPIRKASALAEALRYPGATTITIAREGIKDSDPTVRATAAGAFGLVSPEERAKILAPLLRDPIRQVRIVAARALATARDRFQEGDREAWQKAISEYRQVQQALSERAESHINLAGLDRELGQLADARAQVDVALQLDPDFLPAISMKAEFLAAEGLNGDAITLLRNSLARHPDSGLLNQALGMAFIRARDPAAALQAFRSAWERDRETATYGIVYAVALHDLGNAKDAIALLDDVIARHPESRDAMMIAIRYRIAMSDMEGAQSLAARWLEISPDEPSLSSPARRRQEKTP